MTAARIIDRVQFGYAKAGQKLGLMHTLYRPTALLTPALAPQNRMRELPVGVVATADASYSRPAKIGQAERFGLLDVRGAGAAAVRHGDYLVVPGGDTLFVLSLEADSIPMLASCDGLVTVSRPGGIDAAHEDDYGGRTGRTDVMLLRDWPASMTMSGKTEAGRADLPADLSMKGMTILLPALFGLVIRTSDRLRDDRGVDYTVRGAELSATGWRIDAGISEA